MHRIMRKYMIPIFLLFLAIGMSGFRAEARSVGKLTVHFIDVGEGDSILIQCGGKSMIIDFGYGYSYKKLRNYLTRQRIKKVDYAMLTHPHYDHMGGMPYFLQDFKVKNAFIPLPAVNRPMYYTCINLCKEKRINILHARKGQTYRLGKAKVQIVSEGMQDPFAPNYNDNSYVVRVVHGKNRFLLLGDASKRLEKKIMKSGAPYRANVVKIAHHGAKSGTSKKFLKKIHAKYAVISTGKENKVRHPSAKELKMIHSLGLKMFRTDCQGSIVVKSNGKKLKWNRKPSNNFSGY